MDSQPLATQQLRRNRILYSIFVALVISAGLASRSAAAHVLPDFLREYSGDTLWALMVYLLFAIWRPAWPCGRIAAASFAFAVLIEFSQLYRPEWLERIRDLPGLRLVFGYGFKWSDLLCYASGVGIGWIAESIARSGRVIEKTS